MNKYIYEVNGDYAVVEADSMHVAMVLVASEGGVIIGDYTMLAHLFGE